MKRIFFSPTDLDQHKLAYITPAYAPGIVTTVGPAGNINVATFDQIMVASYRPPRIIMSITSSCDTYRNIVDGSDCVIGFPRLEHVQIAYDAGAKLPRDKSELEFIKGVDTYPSKIVTPPSLKQCWVSLECSLNNIIQVGDHDLVILDVVSVSLDEEVWEDDRIDRRNNLPSVYYTTSGWFFAPGETQRVQLSKNLTQYKNPNQL